MQFKFKTTKKTRSTYQAQQIYWQWFKLKRYIKSYTFSGEEVKPQITFHQQQLPYRYQTFDMDKYVEDQQNVRTIHVLALLSTSFVLSYYFARLIYDDEYRFYVSIRLPYHMKYFDKSINWMSAQKQSIYQELNISEDSDLRIKYHNLKQYLKNSRDRQNHERFRQNIRRIRLQINLEYQMNILYQIDCLITQLGLEPISSYNLINPILDYIISDGEIKQQERMDQKEKTMHNLIHLRKSIQALNENSQGESNIKYLENHTKCDYEIKRLQNKVKTGKEKIQELTVGYMKELQNLREQLYRQAQAGSEYYEVSYFDQTEIKDKKFLELLNNRLSAVKLQFDQKTKNLAQVIQSQKAEIQHFRNQVNELLEKIEYYKNPEYLIRKAFYLESDPYKLWKWIEDSKGSQYILQVFENQKRNYGIDYKTIDKSLMVQKAYERDFQSYKNILETQMIGFMEKILADVYEIRQMNVQLESENDTLRRKQIEQLKAQHQKFESVLNKIIKYHNHFLLRIGISFIQKGQLNFQSEIFNKLSKFKINDIQSSVTEYLIHDVSVLQDKVNQQRIKLQKELQERRNTELKIKVSDQYINQITNILNLKIQNTTEQELKLQKLDEVQIKNCHELLTQLQYQQTTYDKYLHNLRKVDQFTMTDEQYNIESLKRRRLSSKENNQNSPKNKQQYSRTKIVMSDDNCYVIEETNDENQQSGYQQYQSQQISPNRAHTQKELREQEIHQRNQTPKNIEIQMRINRAVASRMENQQHQRTDGATSPQPHIELKSKRSFTIDQTQERQNALNVNNFNSNLLSGFEQLELPRVRRKSEVNRDLKKQLKVLQKFKLYDSDSERSQNLGIGEFNVKKQLHGKPNIVIQYRDYPNDEQQVNGQITPPPPQNFVSPFSEYQKKHRKQARFLHYPYKI
ncbi:hypothetical protein pb186bvf_009918 [Paramecium bursaria]